MRRFVIEFLYGLLLDLGWTAPIQTIKDPASPPETVYVPVEKIVEKVVEVQKIEEKIVEKVVYRDVPVEKIIEVERTVEVPVEVEKVVTVEKIVEVPVEVEKVVTKGVVIRCQFCSEIPSGVLASARRHAREMEANPGVSSEEKRSRVYQTILEELPSEPHRFIGRAIERAVYELRGGVPVTGPPKMRAAMWMPRMKLGG